MAVENLALASGVAGLQQHRLGLGMFAAPGPSRFQRRSGLHYSDAGAADLVGTAATMNAVVNSCTAYVAGTTSSVQGGYPTINGSGFAITFDPGEPAVTRTDRVVLRIRDTTYDASGVQLGDIVIVKGQASGAANAVPASSLLLWEVNVPAGASAGTGGLNWAAVRVDKRTYTAALGGIIPIRDQADRSTLTPHPGMQIWRLDTGHLEFWNGATWWELGPIYARRTVDSAPIANSTSLVSDSQLVIPVQANAVYELSGALMWTGNEVGDIKFALAPPVGCTVHWAISGPDSTDALFASGGTRGRGQFFASLGQTTVPTGAIDMSGSTSPLHGRLTGTLITGGTAGNLTVQWAQQNANGTGTILKAGSLLRGDRAG